MIADKNYYGHDFETTLTAAGIDLLRPTRKGEKTRPGERLFKPLVKIRISVRPSKGQPTWNSTADEHHPAESPDLATRPRAHFGMAPTSRRALVASGAGTCPGPVRRLSRSGGLFLVVVTVAATGMVSSLDCHSRPGPPLPPLRPQRRGDSAAARSARSPMPGRVHDHDRHPPAPAAGGLPGPARSSAHNDMAPAGTDLFCLISVGFAIRRRSASATAPDRTSSALLYATDRDRRSANLDSSPRGPVPGGVWGPIRCWNPTWHGAAAARGAVVHRQAADTERGRCSPSRFRSAPSVFGVIWSTGGPAGSLNAGPQYRAGSGPHRRGVVLHDVADGAAKNYDAHAVDLAFGRMEIDQAIGTITVQRHVNVEQAQPVTRRSIRQNKTSQRVAADVLAAASSSRLTPIDDQLHRPHDQVITQAGGFRGVRSDQPNSDRGVGDDSGMPSGSFLDKLIMVAVVAGQGWYDGQLSV